MNLRPQFVRVYEINQAGKTIIFPSLPLNISVGVPTHLKRARNGGFNEVVCFAGYDREASIQMHREGKEILMCLQSHINGQELTGTIFSQLAFYYGGTPRSSNCVPTRGIRCDATQLLVTMERAAIACL